MVAGLWLLISIAFAHVTGNLKLRLVSGYNYLTLISQNPKGNYLKVKVAYGLYK
jgi:hypothetical protein